MKVKFSIDAIKAKKQFLPLFSTINNSTVLPILESVLIQKDKDLSFTCTDLENTLKIWEPCSGAESFSICLHGRKLKNVINNSIDPAIVVTGDEKKVTIKNGEFSITSTLDSKDNYPKSPVIDKKDEISFTIDTKEILPQVQNALLFVSTDDLRPAMTGICFMDYKGSLHAVATDAHRLYWGEILKVPAGFKGVSFIISKKAARLFLLLFKGDKQVKVAYDKTHKRHIRFSSEGKELFSRLIDARYPDWPVVLPKENNLTFNLLRSQLLSFLKICSPFTDMTTKQLRLTVSKDKITATGGDQHFDDEFSYSLPLYNPNIKFKDFRFGINVMFPKQALSITKDEYVKIDHSCEETKAIIIDNNILIMPLMISHL